jgi:hypothetical protein
MDLSRGLGDVYKRQGVLLKPDGKVIHQPNDKESHPLYYASKIKEKE